MRVLYLNPSGRLGGAETSLLALLEGLRDLHPDWQLSVLLGEDGPLASHAAALGVAVQVLALPPSLSALGDGAGLGWGWAWRILRSIPATLYYRNQLSAAVRDVYPDVIHSNGFKMHLLAAWLPRRKPGCGHARVCHMHDYVSARPLAGRLLKTSIGRFDAVVANSRSVAMDLMKFPAPRTMLTSIYNGVSMARFTPHGGKLDLDGLSGLPTAPAGVVRVGLLATFAKWKGHLIFLRALAQLPEALPIRAYVIGGPIYQTVGSQHTVAELREQAAKHGLAAKVGFTGVVANAAAALRALDIVVHASTRPEPFGMVLIEAMACGKPVILSNAGGAAEIFQDGVTALGHPPGDAATLAKHIERLARDAALRRHLGKNGRAAVASRFQADAMARRFAEVYGQAADSKNVRGETVSKKCFVLD